MNETLKVLESRRSCRNFKTDMVEEEKRIMSICICLLFRGDKHIQRLEE